MEEDEKVNKIKEEKQALIKYRNRIKHEILQQKHKMKEEFQRLQQKGDLSPEFMKKSGFQNSSQNISGIMADSETHEFSPYTPLIKKERAQSSRVHRFKASCQMNAKGTKSALFNVKENNAEMSTSTNQFDSQGRAVSVGAKDKSYAPTLNGEVSIIEESPINETSSAKGNDRSKSEVKEKRKVEIKNVRGIKGDSKFQSDEKHNKYQENPQSDYGFNITPVRSEKKKAKRYNKDYFPKEDEAALISPAQYINRNKYLNIYMRSSTELAYSPDNVSRNSKDSKNKNDESIRKEIRELKKKQTAEMKLFIEAEHEREKVRELQLLGIFDKDKKQETEKAFGLERGRSGLKIQQLAQKHDDQLKKLFSKLKD